MNKRNAKFLFQVVLSKFVTFYDYRKFLVDNFGIDDIKNDLDEKPFSKFKMNNSDKSFYIESKDNIKILGYYEGTVYIHTLNNFIRVEDFKNVMLKDMV